MKSVTVQANAIESNMEVTASDLLMKCGALCALQRESVDSVILQIICWLPALLLQCVRQSGVTGRESLMKEAIELWRWLLAELPLFHVSPYVLPHQ